MAIDVKQRPLCKPHMHLLCCTLALRGMAVASARPADTPERSRSHRLAAIQPARLFLGSFPLHSLSMSFLHSKSVFVSPAQSKLFWWAMQNTFNAMDRGEKTPGRITVPHCEIVKAYMWNSWATVFKLHIPGYELAKGHRKIYSGVSKTQPGVLNSFIWSCVTSK